MAGRGCHGSRRAGTQFLARENANYGENQDCHAADGESITNGTITKWRKQPGDLIQVDEILLDISTDKVESEIPCPVEGRVEVLHFEEGATVDVGIVIAEVEEDLDAPAPSPESSQEVAPAETDEPADPSPQVSSPQTRACCCSRC